MKALYIYNPHSVLEKNMFERAKKELSNHIQDINIKDINTIKNIIPIRDTPALVIIRDDLQGDSLLKECDGQLRVTAELYKALEEEELNIYQAKTHRIDSLINQEIIKGQDKLLEDLLTREVI